MIKDTSFRQRLFIFATCFCVLFFYFWTAWSSQRSFFPEKKESHYNLLTEAFLSGQLHLTVEPPVELLALDDPYDPMESKPYRLHDASLYDGRYYSYFGPAPVLTLYIPWRIITGMEMSDQLATAIFFSGVFLLSVLILIRARCLMAPESSFVLLLLCIAAVGLCTVSPYLLRSSEFYETAIASGSFWFLLSCYLLFIFTVPIQGNPTIHRLMILVFAGICYGLAVASRPNYFPGAIIFLIPLLALRKSSAGAQEIRKTAFSFLIPLASIGVLLMIYNYLRFDNIFELGRTYQLDATTVTDWFNLSNVLHNAYLYLLLPLVPDHIFPFFHLTVFTDWYNIPSFLSHGYDYYGPEPVMGVLPNLPFVLGILPFFAFSLFVKEAEKRVSFFRFFCLLMIPAVLNLIVLLLLSAASMRYILDFMPSFLVAAGVGWMILEEKVRRSLRTWLRTLFYASFSILWLWSAACSMSISLTGYHNSLAHGNPQRFKEIESRFGIIPALYHRFHLDKYGDLKMQLQFPPKEKGVELLAIARTWLGPDAVVAQYLGPSQIRIGVVHTGKVKFSRIFAVDASNDHTLIIEMGSLYPHPLPSTLEKKGYDEEKTRLVRILLDGDIILQGKTEFLEAHPKDVAVAGDGKRKKHGLPLPWFSGDVLSSERVPIF